MIKIVLTDCDGCLTDGCIYISTDGSSAKKFSYKDGYGFVLLQEHNIIRGIVSCDPEGDILYKRFDHLKLEVIRSGVDYKGKKAAIDKILTSYNLSWDELAYMGDEIPDIETMEACRMSFCPANAREQIKKKADHICSADGGDGAFREMCDIITNTLTT